MRPYIDVDVVDEKYGPIYQHLFSFAVAHQVLTCVEDPINLEAFRQISLFRSIQHLDKDLHHR